FDNTARLRDPDTDYLLAETVNPVMDNLRHVAARNGSYKLICSNSPDPANCVFYSLLDDPLEEYPLPRPESCTGYTNAEWTPAAQEWHFCRLLEVVATESFLQAY